MPLPVMTTVEDVDKLTDFLKTKIGGATVREAESVVGKRHTDGRKISALERWGIISRQDEKLILTQMGRDYARAEPQQKVQFLGNVIASIAPYYSTLEWAQFQDLEQLISVDVGARWLNFNTDELGTNNETTINNNVVCFFHLAQGAGVGTLVIGRKGQPTRLQLDRDMLKRFLGRSLVNEQRPTDEDDEVKNAIESSSGLSVTGVGEGEPMPAVEEAGARSEDVVTNIFVGHGKNKKILDQIKTILKFGNFEPVIADEEESTAVPVPDKVMDAMHRCQAGIMNISADEEVSPEDNGQSFKINENVLIEVGAAFVLYRKNVILLVDDRVSLPSNLQGLYICKYAGDSLDFDSAMKLQETLTHFRE